MDTAQRTATHPATHPLLLCALLAAVTFTACNQHPPATDASTDALPPDPNRPWVYAAPGDPNSSAFPVAIDADSQGNLYVAGSFSGVVKFGAKTYDRTNKQEFFVAKLDSSGRLIWATAGEKGVNEVNDLAVDSAGNVYITGLMRIPMVFGKTSLDPKSGSAFIAKLNRDGTALWAVQAGPAATATTSSGCRGTAITLTDKGDVAAAGKVVFDNATFGGLTLPKAGAYVAWLDAAGTFKAVAGIEGDISPEDLALAKGGEAIVVGHYRGAITYGTQTATSTGAEDGLVARLSQAGSVKWLDTLEHKKEAKVMAVAVDAADNAYITGHFNSYNTSNEAQLGSVKISAHGADVAMVAAKLDAAGAVKWARSVTRKANGGSSHVSRGAGIAVYGGGALVVGHFSGAIDMAAQLTSRGRADLVLGYIDDQGWRWGLTGGGVELDGASGVVVQGGATISVVGAYGKSGAFGAINSVAKGLQELYVWQFVKKP